MVEPYQTSAKWSAFYSFADVYKGERGPVGKSTEAVFELGSSSCDGIRDRVYTRSDNSEQGQRVHISTLSLTKSLQQLDTSVTDREAGPPPFESSFTLIIISEHNDECRVKPWLQTSRGK